MPDLVQLDDVRVVQLLHDVDLTVDLLQVRRVQLRLVDDLDGHLQQTSVRSLWVRDKTAVPAAHKLPTSLPKSIHVSRDNFDTAGNCTTRFPPLTFA